MVRLFKRSNKNFESLMQVGNKREASNKSKKYICCDVDRLSRLQQRGRALPTLVEL